MLQSLDIRRAIRKQVKSSAGNYNLNTQGIGGLDIPVPSPAKQEELQCQVACLDSVIGAIRESFEGLDKVNTTFLNAAFGDGQP
jgi:hypothetical protein